MYLYWSSVVIVAVAGLEGMRCKCTAYKKYKSKSSLYLQWTLPHPASSAPQSRPPSAICTAIENAYM